MIDQFSYLSRPGSRAAWIAVLLHASACAPKDDGSSEATTVDTPDGTSGTTDTTGDTTGGATTDDDTPTGSSSSGDDVPGGSSSSGDVVETVGSCTCELDDPCNVSLCPTVAYEGGEETGGGDTEGDAALDAALTCALEALRDRKVGRINWSYYENAGQHDEYGVLEMFGDGTARSSYGGIVDICEIVTPGVGFGPLKPSQSFDTCLGEPDPRDRFACVRKALASVTQGCQEPEEDCDGV